MDPNSPVNHQTRWVTSRITDTHRSLIKGKMLTFHFIQAWVSEYSPLERYNSRPIIIALFCSLELHGNILAETHPLFWLLDKEKPSQTELEASYLMGSLHSASPQAAKREKSTAVLLSYGPCLLYCRNTRQDVPTGATMPWLPWG